MPEIKKKRWCDCKGWQERLALYSVPFSLPNYIHLKSYYVNGEGWVKFEGEDNYTDVAKREYNGEFCPYCGKKIQEENPKVYVVAYVEGKEEYYIPAEGFKSEIFQEALESALFRPVEHFDDDVTGRNDVWGSEGPDCRTMPV